MAAASIFAQTEPDSIKINLAPMNLYYADSIQKSNILSNTNIIKEQKSEYSLESVVEYQSFDSISFDIPEQKISLYKNAEIRYEDIILKSDFVEIFLKHSILFAKGLPDSTGKIKGKPDFTQSNDHFTAETLKYNFKTRKGYITDIITEQGDGFIQGAVVKKLPDNSALFKNGIYTTCNNHQCPHFYIHLSRAKMIPDDKIVTGPAYLVIEDVPTPLAIPFGFFPIKKGRSSGIIIPSYGESANRGFFLENGGYYFAINDYVDLILKGDIYSRGSWAIKTNSSYNKRYKYSGNININYAENYFGERELPDFQCNRDFFVKWSHNQDTRARPNSRFSANVNAGSSSYNNYNPSSTSDYLSNTFQSNVSYQTTIAGKYNFSANLRHSQNTLTKQVDLNLPEIAFSTNRFYPLQKKKQIGKKKWYENTSLSYSMNAQNRISSPDSLLFSNNTLKRMQNGVQHTIPVSNSFKLFKYFTLNTVFNYNEKWYFQTINKSWYNNLDTAFLKIDTISGFKAARDFNLNFALNTRLYGMYKFNKSPVKAIRHVLTPSLAFSWRPDFSNYKYGNYKYALYGTGQTVRYSIFENGIYGYPPSGRSGSVNLALANNLEMKVRSNKDSISGLKKVILIENLTLAISYDIAKDSLNWSDLSVSGKTRLFKNLDIRYAGLWSPYAKDSCGRTINTTIWDASGKKRLFEHKSTDWYFTLRWNLSSKNTKSKKKPENADEYELAQIQKNPDAYIDFDNPWNINIDYNFRYSNIADFAAKGKQKKIVQTFSCSGDFNLTSKWKVGFTSGYDFEANKISYTSIDIYRDLHCWEMIFNWIPTGFRKSYNFTIRVKSTVLQDLKLTKKTDWRDYY